MSQMINYHVRISGNENVGISITHNNINVYLPIGYDNTRDNDDIKRFMRLLARESKIREEYTESNFDFISFFRVIDDYYNYGLYKQSQRKRTTKCKGKTNWQRTVHQKQLYLNNRVIYTNLVNEYIDYKCEKEVQAIQEYCLYKISDLLGEILGFTYRKCVRMYSDKQMIFILKQELKRTNEDRKTIMLSNLIRFIKNSNYEALTEDGEFSIKNKGFKYIFQDLVDYYGLSLNQKREKDYYPKAQYIRWKDNKKMKTEYKSFPDTIIDLKEKDEFIILDAKYHGVSVENGILKHFPNEYEVFKQLRYKNYLMNKTGRKIKNAFIIPKNLNGNFAEMEEFYATSADHVDNVEDRIYVIYVDTKNLIIDTNATMKEVINIIEGNIK